MHRSKARSSADGRQQLGWKEQSVRASPPSAQTLTLSSVSGLSPPPPSPFNLRKPYRQLTHSRQHPAYLFIQSGSGSGLLLICSLDSVSYGNTRAFSTRLYLHIALSLDKRCTAFKQQQQQKDRDQIKQCTDRQPAAKKKKKKSARKWVMRRTMRRINYDSGDRKINQCRCISLSAAALQR